MLKILLYLALFFKQFYLLPSGTFQLGDILFAAAWAGTVIKNIGEKRKLPMKLRDMPFMMFVILASDINLCYFLVYGDPWFLKSTLYVVYILGVIWVFRQNIEDKIFVARVGFVIKWNIFLQFLIFICGKGRYLFESRYSGTFNDPNQMAFFLFSSYLLMTVVTHIRRKKQTTNLPYFLMVLILVYYSKSAGISLGLAVFLTVYPVLSILKYNKRKAAGIKLAAAGTMLLFLAVGLAWIIISSRWQPSDGYSLGARINEKFVLVQEGGISRMLAERGMDRIWKYPEYLVYGAGEGQVTRFEGLSMYAELHSTPLGIWFCYGTIPFALIVYWTVRNARGTVYPVWAGIYLALMAEAFFLVNYRQPMFWLIFVFGSICTRKGLKEGRRYEAN